MIRRLRLKFVCIVMSIVTLMLCAIFAMVFYFTSRNLERESFGMMQAVAQDPMRLNGLDDVPEAVRLPYCVLELDEDGGIVSVGGGYYDLSDYELLDTLIQLSDGRSAGVLEDYGLRFCRVFSHGTEYLVFADMSSETSVMKSLVENCLLIGLLSFCVFLAVSLLLARWTVKPVEFAWDRQRQFVADASHELKTPLTVILSNAQLLNDAGNDPELNSRLGRNILVMSERMRGLVDDLLELARVDEGLPSQGFERLCLSRLVSEATLPFEPLFFERGLSLECEIEPDIHVRGDREQLVQCLGILLDNAQKYASEHGYAFVRLRAQGRGYCLLTVENSGVPLSQRELRDIFKRFYRIDSSRTGDSFGLGLAIAKGMVEAHKGRIWAESFENGNRFCISLRVQK